MSARLRNIPVVRAKPPIGGGGWRLNSEVGACFHRGALARMMRISQPNMETVMAPTAVAAGTPHRSNIRVCLAVNGGWLVTVERDGRVVTTEHHTDWHRVERRVAVLESSVMSDCAHASRPEEGFDAHMGQMITGAGRMPLGRAPVCRSYREGSP